MKKEENNDELNKKNNKPDPKGLRQSHLFQVVLEFYVRQIELSFSCN